MNAKRNWKYVRVETEKALFSKLELNTAGRERNSKGKKMYVSVLLVFDVDLSKLN